MKPENSPHRPRPDVREAILEAARELFVELGYEGVSLRKVATKIGYSATTIYLHFADKEALFHELCGQDFGRLAAAFQVLVTIPDPRERLLACGRAYIEFAVAHPKHYQLMFMTEISATATSEAMDCAPNPDENAYLFLRVLVEECMRVGAFRQDLADVDLIAQTLWAAVHGVAALQITACRDNSIPWREFPLRCEALLDSITQGMMRRPERTEN